MICALGARSGIATGRSDVNLRSAVAVVESGDVEICHCCRSGRLIRSTRWKPTSGRRCPYGIELDRRLRNGLLSRHGRFRRCEPRSSPHATVVRASRTVRWRSRPTALRGPMRGEAQQPGPESPGSFRSPVASCFHRFHLRCAVLLALPSNFVPPMPRCCIGVLIGL